MNPKISIIGCGKVGTTFGIHLSRAGYEVIALYDDIRANAERASELIDGAEVKDSGQVAARAADVVIITTPDGIIEQACSALADAGGFRSGQTVLHCSGALPSTILSAAADSGADTGSMHPMQAFAAIASGENPFNGIVMSVEGTEGAVHHAGDMVTALGARPFIIRTEGKMLYHAAAVVASNYLVSLLDVATQMFSEAGIPEEESYSILEPLLQGTMANIGRAGTRDALTGPIVRGDAETVAAHVETIKNTLPHLLPAYKSLGMIALGLTRQKGDLEESKIDLLERILK